MMVMVEGRRPRCWGCKQIGHIAKFCPQRPENKDKAAPTATTTTKDIAAATTTTIKEAKVQGPGQVQPKLNNQEGWTEVTRKRRGSPKKGEKSPSSSSPPQKQIKAPSAVAVAATPEPPATPAPVSPTPATPTPATPTPKTHKSTASPTTSTATPKTPAAAVPPMSPKKNKKKSKQQIEDMDTSVNLKRRRDSGEGAAKKICPEQPKAGPSSQLQNQILPPPPPSPVPPPPFPPQILQPTQPPHQIVTLSLQQEQFLKKCRRPYQIPLPRSQSTDRSQPLNLTRTPSLPSLSPSTISSQELFPAKQRHDPPASKKTTNRQEGELSIQQIQREEEVRRFPDRYIASVKTADGRLVRSSREMRDAFRAHFRDRFARCPDLPIREFRSYLADFPRSG